MLSFNHVPLLRILFPFAGGILWGIFIGLNIQAILVLILILALLQLPFVLLKNIFSKWKMRWMYGIILNLFFFFIGMICVWFRSEIFKPDHFNNFSESHPVYVGCLAEPYHEKEKSYKAVLEIKEVVNHKRIIPVCGHVVAYFKKSPQSEQLKYGDVILFRQSPAFLKPPQNPEEFNYKRFLFFHNIYHQVYLDDKAWVKTGHSETNPFRQVAYSFRDKLMNILKENIPTQREFAVASALVLGYGDDIDQHLLSAYASAGALHVLSVSGMHVGLIYVLLNWLLSFLNGKKSLRLIKYIFLISFIWFYALLTGFSPSVLRSAVMISIVITGYAIGGSSGLLNSMIVSLFLLLLYNPFLITEVGFQLSYLAVFGIVYLHPKLVLMWEAPSWLLHKIWEITSVSLCAQLMTFPLSVLYFHQFPNLFLISNLVVIPLSTIIIYLCIFVLAFHAVPFIGVYSVKLLAGLIYLLNKSVLLVDSIPHSIIQGLNISIAETWIIYAFILLAVFYLMTPQSKILLSNMVVLIILLAFQLQEKFDHRNQKSLVVYAINKHSAIDFITGTDHLFLADSAFYINKEAMLFSITHNWWARGLTDAYVKNYRFPSSSVKNNFLEIKNHFIQFSNKKLFIADDKIKLPIRSETSLKIKLDYLILSKNQPNKIQKLLSFFDCKKIIIDSSNSKWKVDKWIKEIKETGTSFWSTSDSGAFVEDI